MSTEAGSKEVEVKFRIENIASLESLLEKAKFRRITPATLEINTLYDLRGQKLRRRGELLRLRSYGDCWTLTHKAKSSTGRHKSRVEWETQVKDGAKMHAILQSLGYAATFRYEKYRAEWSDDVGHVVLDQTPIGDFGEIEGPPRWIDRTAKALGIPRSEYITESYAPLFFAWRRRTGSKAAEMTFQAVGGKRH